jgi:hypothetical protein
MKGKPIELEYTLEEVESKLTPGPMRVMVKIIPTKPRSSVLEIPEYYQESAEAEMRTCRVISVGTRIGLELKAEDTAIIIYRPSQKLWDTAITSDGHQIAFIPEKMFIGAIWTT